MRECCRICVHWARVAPPGWKSMVRSMGWPELEDRELEEENLCIRYPQTVQKLGRDVCGEFSTHVNGNSMGFWDRWEGMTYGASDREGMEKDRDERKERIALQKKLKVVRKELRELKAEVKA